MHRRPFEVSIPRRVRRRFPRNISRSNRQISRSLNPPKGPPTISTSPGMTFAQEKPEAVSIPRRVRRRFPPRDSKPFVKAVKEVVSIPRRVRRRFPRRQNNVRQHPRIFLSQSPEGSADDFHFQKGKHNAWNRRMSQSPEGSADDFHGTKEPSPTSTANPCLNLPKGPPTIST